MNDNKYSPPSKRIMITISPQFGEDFRDVRLSRGFTLDRTSRALDIPRTSLSNAERGMNLSAAVFLEMCAWAELDANKYKAIRPTIHNARQLSLF